MGEPCRPGSRPRRPGTRPTGARARGLRPGGGRGTPRGRPALTLTTSNSAIPLTVRLDPFIRQYTVDWQHLSGASLVATIPVLILFALIERRVVGGLTAGSIR